MQPAEEEGAESVAVVALRSDVKQQQSYRQNEAGDYCVSQRSKDPSHFHSPKQRYSPCFDPSREASVVTLRCLSESRPRTEERLVGKEWVSTCRYRGSPSHKKKK